MAEKKRKKILLEMPQLVIDDLDRRREQLHFASRNELIRTIIRMYLYPNQLDPATATEFKYRDAAAGASQ